MEDGEKHRTLWSIAIVKFCRSEGHGESSLLKPWIQAPSGTALFIVFYGSQICFFRIFFLT